MPFCRVSVAILVAALSGVVVPAFAKVGDTDGLVGLSARNGESALEDRGYLFIKARKVDDEILANWWNADSKTCVTVVTRDGIYDALKTSPPPDCNQAGPVHRHPHNFQDLVGARASSVDMRMDRDGFRVVDQFEGTNVTSTWWHSRKTAECVKVDVVKDRVEKVSRAPGYPACKA